MPSLDLLHFCQSMTRPVTFITRLRLDAALYEPAPPRLPGQMGRPRLKGQRLPTLKQLLDQPATAWTAVMVPWYDGNLRRVETASHTAVWYHKGKAPVPIRWVLIRDPMGAFRPQALLCTELNVEPTQIIEWFVLRWQLEVTFQEVRTHLGVETQRQWSDLAIARTTPALFGLFSWVTLAAHALGRAKPYPSAQQPGIQRHCLPSPMLSLWSAITYGPTQTFSAYRLLNPTSENSLAP